VVRRPNAFVALLRGINVGGTRKVPMAKLRSVVESQRCSDVKTYIQSGNVVFASGGSTAELEIDLETAIERTFGLAVPVLVRKASVWRRLLATNPFPEEARDEPGKLLLALSKRPPNRGAESALQRFATQGERIERRGDALWIHYASGIARSKLTPAVLDREAGSPVTARNWRTVLALDEMARDLTGGSDR